MGKTYFQLLKEAVSGENTRYDDSYYKGPMIDPILSYDGSGDLRGKKDAASILERFYFSEEDVLDTGRQDLLKEQDTDDTLVKEEDKEKEDEKENEELAEDNSEDLDIDEEALEEDDHSPTDGKDKLEDATGEDESGTFDEEDDQKITTEAIVIERLIKEMEESDDDDDDDDDDKEDKEELEEEDHSPTDGLEKVLDSTGEDDKGTLEESEDKADDSEEDDDDDDEDEEELKEDKAVTNSKTDDLDEKELEEAFKLFEDELKKSLID